MWPNRRRGGSPLGVTVPNLDDEPGVPAGRLRRLGRRLGRKDGRLTALGGPLADTTEQLPGRQLLTKSMDVRIADIKRFVHERESELKAAIAKVKEQRDNAAARLGEVQKEHDRAQAELESLPSDRAMPTWLYLICLILLGVFEYPTIAAALETFPAGRITRVVLGIALSGALAVMAHFVARNIRRVIEESQRSDRKRRVMELRTQEILLGLSIVGIIALMATLALTRGGSFSDIANLTGGEFHHTGIAGWLMLSLQFVLFVIALAAGLSHAEGDARRHLRHEVRKLRKERRVLEDELERIDTALADLGTRLAQLEEHEQLWIQREEELRSEVLARYDHGYTMRANSILFRLIGRRVAPRDPI
jgi:hypothetical protein